jgi:hypothetical protein
VSEIQLDPYLPRYADRTKGMTASAIRALFAVASRPEVVSLAGGNPDTAALDFDAVRRPRRWSARPGPRRCSTAGGRAPGPAGAARRGDGRRGVPAHTDDLVVTNGGQQGLDLLAKLFCDPGRRHPRRGAVLRRRPRRLRRLPGRGRPRPDGRRGADPRRPRRGRRPPRRGGPAPQVPLHDPEPPEPRRGVPVAGAPPPRRRARRGPRPHDRRGQPLRPAGLQGGDATVAARASTRSASSTSGRCRRSSPRASASAGWRPRGRSARSSSC